MACRFDERTADIGAQIIRAIHREWLIRPRLDILAYPDDFLLERYRFSRKSLIHLNSLLKPYIANTTNRGPCLSSLIFRWPIQVRTKIFIGLLSYKSNIVWVLCREALTTESINSPNGLTSTGECSIVAGGSITSTNPFWSVKLTNCHF